jgi:hypothetical protein
MPGLGIARHGRSQPAQNTRRCHVPLETTIIWAQQKLMALDTHISAGFGEIIKSNLLRQTAHIYQGDFTPVHHRIFGYNASIRLTLTSIYHRIALFSCFHHALTLIASKLKPFRDWYCEALFCCTCKRSPMLYPVLY